MIHLGSNTVGVGMYEKVTPKEKARYVLDANGQATTVSGTLDLSDVKSIGNYGLHTAYGDTQITSLDMSELTSVGSYGLQYGFQTCSSLASVDMSKLTSIGNYGLQYAFRSCSNLASVDMSKLTSIGSYGLSYAFENCYKLEAIHFDESPSVPGINTGLNWTNAGRDVPDGYKVVVPDELVDAWKSASYWSDIASHIVSVSDYYGVKGLRFKNVGDSSSTFKLMKIGNPTSISLEYTTGGKTPTYLPYTIGDEIEVGGGMSIWIRSSAASQGFSTDSNNYYQFVLNGEFEAKGSVMYLVGKDGDATEVPAYAFINLFKDCATLTKAPDLPATTLNGHCYESLFDGCSSLNTIDIIAYEGDFDTNFTNWVRGVASNGTLLYGGTDTTVGDSAIPTGWRSLVTSHVTFTSRQDGSTIRLSRQGSPDTIHLQCDTGNGWEAFLINTDYTLDNGETLKVRADPGNPNTNGFGQANESSFHQFNITGQVEAAGDAMSMLDTFLQLQVLPQRGFRRLFYECKGLVKAPDIGAKEIGYASLGQSFEGCTNLVQGPHLGFTQFSSSSSYACYQLFRGCSNLNIIKLDYTGTFGTSSSKFSNWVNGLPSTGTFYYNGSDTTRGINNVPSGWTITPFSA